MKSVIIDFEEESWDDLEKIIDQVEVEIFHEQIRQIEKFGHRNQDHALWHLILSEEVGEVAQEVLRIRFDGKSVDDLRKELIQVAAVAKSWIENIDIITNKIPFTEVQEAKG